VNEGIEAAAEPSRASGRRLQAPAERPHGRGGDERRAALPAQVRGPHTTRAGDTLTALRFDNGFGGLTPDDDYEIRVRDNRVPPAPWANVIANEQAGFIVTERGIGCTWVGNAQFYRLTPWHNDPVSDPPSDMVYLRDEETQELWGATPAPVADAGSYTVRHSAGATEFAYRRAGIASSLTVGVAAKDAVRISLLRVTNEGDQPRRIGLTSYVEWTLGTVREHSQHQVVAAFDAGMQAHVAFNTFNPSFASLRAFAALSEPVSSQTSDRREFLGRNGSIGSPAAFAAGRPLSGAEFVGVDPCSALQCILELAPGETRDVVILLGAGDSGEDARELIARYRAPAAATAALGEATEAWKRRLSVVTVSTPEPTFDAMINRWSLYQALSCRFWGRAAVYQSSGAFGFRDQLQDVLAFLYAEPALAREHIIRAAGRQFTEGDVQHWWHPPDGRGVRTRFSDDLAWLPFVVEHYVRITGDRSVLDESAGFITMRALAPNEHELYDLPQPSGTSATIYEHCLLALRRASTVGERGLPLMGIGDWNDGMNRVGVEGKGESVWLGWFLATTLRAFSDIVETRGEAAVAAELRARASAYAGAVDAHGWDGEWYRRAYFDDGTPLGSARSEECRIDSIAQSWSVISGAGDPARRPVAMQSVEKHLVHGDDRLIQLLAPPFDASPVDPGYIKGYLPGVRENGAQYTHAALWVVQATALLGNGARAFELYQMLNPLARVRDAESVARYRAEPYVVAADVYTAKGQYGRGGWTWYTGSASWMYRVGVESILGFRKQGNTLRIDPNAPPHWKEYRIDYRFGETPYAIVVRAGDQCSAPGMTLDGVAQPSADITLVDDGQPREIVITRPPPS
jgi:cyclic beta-1,2-glucan synthetase